MEQVLGLLKEMGIPAGVLLALGIMWFLWKIEKAVAMMGAAILSLQGDVKNLVDGKMWVNQCNERHQGINRTLENHELRIHDLEKER